MERVNLVSDAVLGDAGVRCRHGWAARLKATAVLLLMAGCSQPGCQPMVAAELLFGAGDDVGFTDFLDRSVTPRFPAGLTVVDAEGRWRAPNGSQTRERSKRVLIVVPREPDPRPALDAIRAEYKERFHQQSVGLLLSRSCASF